MISLLSAVVSIFLLMVGCKEAPRQSVAIDSRTISSRSERITAAMRYLQTDFEMRIQDADYIEEQIGDGFVGPSDFVLYMRLQLDPESISRWKRHLEKLKGTHDWSPKTKVEWWALEGGNMEWYQSAGLIVGRHSAIAFDNGNLAYVVLNTM